MDLGLSGKRALVTAASQGLGKAIATELAREGCRVMIASRREQALMRAAEEIRQEVGHADVTWHQVDVADAESIQQLVQAAKGEWGGIDLLVTNAGGPTPGGFDDVTDGDWQQAFVLNLLSVVRLIRETLPLMRAQKYGRIVNVSSLSVREPIPNLILSNAVRAGVVGMLKTLANEVAQDGILVHNLAPGRIATDRIVQLDRAIAEKIGVSAESVRESQELAIPLKRYGQPEEFAKMAVLLLSSANSYMTGETVLVDGGALRST